VTVTVTVAVTVAVAVAVAVAVGRDPPASYASKRTLYGREPTEKEKRPGREDLAGQHPRFGFAPRPGIQAVKKAPEAGTRRLSPLPPAPGRNPPGLVVPAK